MNNGDIKSKERDSPKTPGGIGKSHLTSIRRLGLSRKWKKSGVSPFVSPLACNTITNPVDNSQEETKTRKRKLRLDDENIELSPKENDTNDIGTPPPVCEEIPHSNDSTPIRRATRNKSRTIPYKREESAVTTTTYQVLNVSKESYKTCEEEQISQDIKSSKNSTEPVDIVEKKKELYELENIPIVNIGETTLNENRNVYRTVNPELPKTLLKECIFIIQNKLSKKIENKNIKKGENLSNSDDDIPLSNLNKNTQENNNSDDNFKNKDNKSSPKVKPVKKTKSTNKKRLSTKKQNKREQVQSSQSSFSDDDDFDYSKKTIYFPKNDRIIKPVKAKSTGSITQKDIDDLKARIEMKKQLLLANAQSKDTEEVRGLIKKWRRGCQDALMELLELMKNKLQNSDMNYATILEMLKIPPSYVGYDEENDCFSTPDDKSILASIFSDL